MVLFVSASLVATLTGKIAHVKAKFKAPHSYASQTNRALCKNMHTCWAQCLLLIRSCLVSSIMPALGKVLVGLESAEVSVIGACDMDELNYRHCNCFWHDSRGMFPKSWLLWKPTVMSSNRFAISESHQPLQGSSFSQRKEPGLGIEQLPQILDLLSTMQGAGHRTGHTEWLFLSNIIRTRTYVHTVEAQAFLPNFSKPGQALHRECFTHCSGTWRHLLNHLFSLLLFQ